MSSDVITKTHNWFVKAGQMPDKPKLDVKQAIFYTSMQVEELSEKLQALLGRTPLNVELENLVAAMRAGDWDRHVNERLPRQPLENILDGDMDLIWVSIGAAYALGADAQGAYNEVAKANWAKFPSGVVTRHPTTGKVIKPEGWTEPNLAPFLGEKE